MEIGKLVGFDGRPVNHQDQEPMLAGNWQKSECNDLLPSYFRRTFRLVSFEHEATADPYVLYNQFGQIVKQWPEGVEQSYSELDEACTRAMRGEV